MRPLSRAGAALAVALLPGAAPGAGGHARSAQPPVHDLVVLGGRVVDPASGLDGVRHVGIAGGRIAVVADAAIAGRDTLDARGLVVAPGFIDLHAHGQNDESYRYYAMDGVTTALELETGVWPVAAFYAARAGRARVNFGGSVSHLQARRAVVRAAGGAAPGDAAAVGRGAREPTTPALRAALRAALARGLDDGALGVGIGIAYTPGASRPEIRDAFALCAARGVVCAAHLRRGGVAGLQEVIAAAAATGASLHVAHVNSTGGAAVRRMLHVIARARARGIDVTTEAYPYTSSSTWIQAAPFDSVPEDDARARAWLDRLVWAETGERLTPETFRRYRAQGGVVIELDAVPDSAVTIALADPTVLVVSDGIAYANGRGHPRLAGTHARLLGRYVRERRVLTLQEAIRRSTELPARRLEASVPALRTKGRLAPGMDADVTVFDAARILDLATVEAPARYATGVVHVLVHGVPVVRDGRLVEGVAPGRAVRRPEGRGAPR